MISSNTIFLYTVILLSSIYRIGKQNKFKEIAFKTISILGALFGLMVIALSRGNIDIKYYSICTMLSFAFTFMFFAPKHYWKEYIWAFIFLSAVMDLVTLNNFKDGLLRPFEAIFIRLPILFILNEGREIKDYKYAMIRFCTVHVFSMSLLMAGIINISSELGGGSVINLAHYINDFNISTINIGCLLLFVSLLVSTAAVPFSSWLPDISTKITSFSFMILLITVIPISLYVTLKVFLGATILVQIGAVTMLYGSIMAMLESNLRRILCFINIFKSGFILAEIGASKIHVFDHNILISIISLIIFNIVIAATIYCLESKYSIKKTSDIREVALNQNGIDATPFIIGILAAFSLIISFPTTFNFAFEGSILSLIKEQHYISHKLIVGATSIILLAVPWKELKESVYINFKDKNIFKEDIAVKMLLPTFLILIWSISGVYMPQLNLLSNQLLQIAGTMVVTGAFYNKDYKVQGILLGFDYFYRQTSVIQRLMRLRQYIESKNFEIELDIPLRLRNLGFLNFSLVGVMCALILSILFFSLF